MATSTRSILKQRKWATLPANAEVLVAENDEPYSNLTLEGRISTAQARRPLIPASPAPQPPLIARDLATEKFWDGFTRMNGNPTRLSNITQAHPTSALGSALGKRERASDDEPLCQPRKYLATDRKRPQSPQSTEGPPAPDAQPDKSILGKRRRTEDDEEERVEQGELPAKRPLFKRVSGVVRNMLDFFRAHVGAEGVFQSFRDFINPESIRAQAAQERAAAEELRRVEEEVRAEEERGAEKRRIEAVKAYNLLKYKARQYKVTKPNASGDPKAAWLAHLSTGRVLEEVEPTVLKAYSRRKRGDSSPAGKISQRLLQQVRQKKEVDRWAAIKRLGGEVETPKGVDKQRWAHVLKSSKRLLETLAESRNFMAADIVKQASIRVRKATEANQKLANMPPADTLQGQRRKQRVGFIVEEDASSPESPASESAPTPSHSPSPLPTSPQHEASDNQQEEPVNTAAFTDERTSDHLAVIPESLAEDLETLEVSNVRAKLRAEQEEERRRIALEEEEKRRIKEEEERIAKEKEEEERRQKEAEEAKARRLQEKQAAIAAGNTDALWRLDAAELEEKPMIFNLNETWDNKVSQVMAEARKRRARAKVVAHTAVANTEITLKDIETLLPKEWLNDAIIEGFTQAVVKNAVLMQTVDSTLEGQYWAPTAAFYSTLSNSGPATIKNWTSRRNVQIHGSNLLRTKAVIIPVNENASHWTLIVVNGQEKTVTYYDSLQGRNERPLEHVMEWIEFESKRTDNGAKPFEFKRDEWTINKVDTSPRQHNGYDCGVFVCFNALAHVRFGGRRALRGKWFNQEDITKARKLVLAVLLNGGFVAKEPDNDETFAWGG